MATKRLPLRIRYTLLAKQTEKEMQLDMEISHVETYTEPDTSQTPNLGLSRITDAMQTNTLEKLPFPKGVCDTCHQIRTMRQSNSNRPGLQTLLQWCLFYPVLDNPVV